MTINGKKDSCPQGHPYDEDNTYLNNGKRYCKQCSWYRLTRRRKAKAVEEKFLELLGPYKGKTAYEEYLKRNNLKVGPRGITDRRGDELTPLERKLEKRRSSYVKEKESRDKKKLEGKLEEKKEEKV